MRTPSLASLAVAALALTACGEKSEPSRSDRPPAPQPFALALDGAPGPAHAGVFSARAAGDFERAGLDVRPLPGRSTLSLVGSGRVDLGLASAPQLLAARRGVGGADLVSVGAVVQRPLIGVVTLASARVRSVHDLRGKRVGVPRDAAPGVQTMLAAGDVDKRSVRRLPPDRLIDALARRRIDAAVGVRIDAAEAALARASKRARSLRADQAGVPTYPELLLVARRTSLDTDGAARLRRFLQALGSGQRRVRANPAAAVDALATVDRSLDRRATALAVRRVAPLLLPRDQRRPFGYQRRGEWSAFGRWLARTGARSGGGDSGGALTNEFLPGEGFKRDSEVDGAPGLAPPER